MLHLHMLIRQISCSKILILGQNPSFWQHWGLLQHNVMLYDIDITAATNTSSIISSMEEALWLQTVTGVNCLVTFTITSI